MDSIKSTDNMQKTNLTSTEQVAYLCGAIAQQLANRPIAQYLLLFYTNCMLLDAKVAGIIFLVGRLIDAITDIIMANLSDKTRTRFGTYRPYILYGCFPLAFTFIAVFTNPTFIADYNLKLVWAYVFYFLEASVFNTICGVNYGALPSVISATREERTKLGTARSVGESIAVLFVSATAMTIVIKFGGVSNPTGWTIFATITAVLILILYLICFAGTKEKVEVIPKGKDPLPFKERIKVLKGNTPFFSVFLCCLALMFIAVFTGTSFSYYCIYVLGSPNLIAPLFTLNGIASIVGALTLPRLVKHFELRWTLSIGAMLYLLASIVLVIFSNVAGAAIYQILAGLGNAIGLATIWTIIPECNTYGTWKNRVSAPGLVFAFIMFAIKCMSGLGTYAVSFVLSFTGFNPTLKIQPESVLSGLSFSIVVIPAILAIIVILLSFLMKPIDRKNMEIINAELSIMKSN